MHDICALFAASIELYAASMPVRPVSTTPAAKPPILPDVSFPAVDIPALTVFTAP